MPSAASVVITTKNRKQDLPPAIESALAQTARPQVLVIDDGSTDGTAEMVRERYPQVRLERVGQSQGYIVQRNWAASLAEGEIIFSIDDDAAFSTPHVVEQTLKEFDHPRVGAVAIPFINVRGDQRLNQRAPGDRPIYARYDYIGTAHAVRRELFLKLGGYRSVLFHQGEEKDFCLRMLNAGYIVRAGRADPIHHFESPRRDFRRIDIYGRRNDILFAWHNVPWALLPLHLGMTTFNSVRVGLRLGRLGSMMRGSIKGYGSLWGELGNRQPVSTRAYRLNRRLRAGDLPLEEIEAALPPMTPATTSPARNASPVVSNHALPDRP